MSDSSKMDCGHGLGDLVEGENGKAVCGACANNRPHIKDVLDSYKSVGWTFDGNRALYPMCSAKVTEEET